MDDAEAGLAGVLRIQGAPRSKTCPPLCRIELENNAIVGACGRLAINERTDLGGSWKRSRIGGDRLDRRNGGWPELRLKEGERGYGIC